MAETQKRNRRDQGAFTADPALIAEARRCAADRGETFSTVIRDALAVYLREHGREVTTAA